jgi:hypothetical protein
MNKKSFFTVAALFIGILAVSAQSAGAGGQGGDQSTTMAHTNAYGIYIPGGITWPANPADRVATYNAAVQAYLTANPNTTNKLMQIQTADKQQIVGIPSAKNLDGVVEITTVESHVANMAVER